MRKKISVSFLIIQYETTNYLNERERKREKGEINLV